MRAPSLLLAIPSLAMAVVGLALFGPGAVQPFDGGRIYGGPSVGLRRLSWRILVLERFRGIDSTRNLGSIIVRARDGDRAEQVARCHTRGDGTCDVALDFTTPVSGPVHAVITTEMAGPALAEGIIGNAAAWGRAGGHPAELTGSTSGDLSIDVAARRGIFAAPFRDDLVVTVRDGGATVPGAHVTLRTDAADLAGAPATSAVETSVTLVTSDRGEANFGVAPRMHTAEVDIEVASVGRSAKWHGLLPVVPGAMWLDPNVVLGSIRVIAPVPRDVAYVTIATERARLWGGVIPLETADARGYAIGHIDWPAEATTGESGATESSPRELKWVTISSDPLQTSGGTVGWPVSREGVHDERLFRDQLLLDGLPAAEKRDQNRRYRARTLSAVALGAAAVLEGVLLAQSAHARGIRAWAWTAMAVATVAFAFAAIGVVVMWKTGG